MAVKTTWETVEACRRTATRHESASRIGEVGYPRRVDIIHSFDRWRAGRTISGQRVTWPRRRREEGFAEARGLVVAADFNCHASSRESAD